MLKVNHMLKYVYPYERVNERNVNNNMKVGTIKVFDVFFFPTISSLIL